MPQRSALISVVLAMIIGTSLVSCSDNQSTPVANKESEKKKDRPHLVEISKAAIVTQGIIRERTGSLHAQKEIRVINQEEGQLIAMPFFEGDSVREGDVVARLDDSLLVAQLARAEASRFKAENDLKRIQGLRQQNFSSEEDLARVSTELAVAEADVSLLKTRLSFTKIKAPFSGVVIERILEPGSVAERYSHLLTIADLSSLNTEVSVSELILSRIKLNDVVGVQIDALGNQVYQGRISRIHPSINPDTRLGLLEVQLKPVPPGARPGQFVRLRFDIDEAPRLVIPFSALRTDENGQFIYLVDDEDKVQRVTITTGLRLDENIEVLAGLSEGQRIIVKGFLGLKPGKKVKVISGKPKAEQGS